MDNTSSSRCDLHLELAIVEPLFLHNTYLAKGMNMGHDIMLAALFLDSSDPKVVVRDDEMLFHLSDGQISDGVDTELSKAGVSLASGHVTNQSFIVGDTQHSRALTSRPRRDTARACAMSNDGSAG